MLTLGVLGPFILLWVFWSTCAVCGSCAFRAIGVNTSFGSPTTGYVFLVRHAVAEMLPDPFDQDIYMQPIGDVKEFGFRQIPDDGNYASHFSADLSTPKAASAEDTETAFSESRPSAESDLIDLGEGKEKAAAGQGQWKGDQQAVEKAIKGINLC